MIKNEHQYKTTRKLAVELEVALATLPNNSEFKALPRLMQKAHSSSLKRQLAQHYNETREYELLKAGEFNFDKVPSFENIAIWLIQARIAKGLRQEDLARLLKLRKQQIQQYEATDYASASLHRLEQVFAILRSCSPSHLVQQGVKHRQKASAALRIRRT